MHKCSIKQKWCCEDDPDSNQMEATSSTMNAWSRRGASGICNEVGDALLPDLELVLGLLLEIECASPIDHDH